MLSFDHINVLAEIGPIILFSCIFSGERDAFVPMLLSLE
jgi:hypothetical protein